ncbi:MAG TPA: histidine triad nucleotide-binding protein [Acidobacteriaceae bacterium]
MATDCLFCKIAAGDIAVKRLYEDDLCLCFPDINPQAPTHVLIIPKKHIASHAHAEPEDEKLLGHMMAKAVEIAREQGLTGGYRVVMNTGRDGGQTVDHLHLHLMGGRHMTWPPG